MNTVNRDMISALWINVQSDFHGEYQGKIPARHGSVEDGVIGFIEEVIDLQLGGEGCFLDMKFSPGPHIIHKIGIEGCALGQVIAGGGISFTESVVLISQKPISVGQVY